MEIEYVGEFLADGHLSVDSFIADKLIKGAKVKIKIEIFTQQKNLEKSDAAAVRILQRMRNAKAIGTPDKPEQLRHSVLLEERLQEKNCDRD